MGFWNEGGRTQKHFNERISSVRGGSRIFEGGGGAYYKTVVFGALIKYHFGSSRNDASLCAHKLIQV